MDDATETPLNGQEMTPQPLRIKNRTSSDQNSGSPGFKLISVSPSATVHHESRIPRKSSFKPDLHAAYAATGNTANEVAVSQAETSPQVFSPNLNVRKTRTCDHKSSHSSIPTNSKTPIQNPSSSAQGAGKEIAAQDGTATHGRINGSEDTPKLVANRRENSDNTDTSGTETFIYCGVNMGFKLEESRAHPRRHQQGASGVVKKSGLGIGLPSSPSLPQYPNVSSLSDQSIIRQPSFRHRMLNRMASGFPTDLDLAQSSVNSGIGRAPLHTSHTIAQEGRAEVKLRSTTLDSTRSLQTLPSSASPRGNGLESKIDSFLSPPDTASTMIACPKSFSRAALQPVRPKEVTILGARLTVVPERSRVLSADIDGMESFFVAVQVEGFVDPTTTITELKKDVNFLDIIVIIDNSLYTSPIALLSSCDIAGEIASALDTDQDRLAIGTTSPLGERRVGRGLMLMPLSKISPGRVRTLLDNVVGCASIPPKDYLSDQIEHAKRHLELLVPHFYDMEPSCVRVGHIVVVTPNPGAIPQSCYLDKSIGLHVICPGSVPWRRIAAVTAEGWRILNLFQPTEPAQAMKSTGYCAKIRNLISDLRSGSNSGKLLNIDVAIKASPDCATDGSMGVGFFHSLQPGEQKTIMVRVKMRTPRLENAFPSNFDRTKGTSPNDDLIRDMEAMLGPKSVPILRIKLRYNHSKLSSGTVLEMRSTASVEVTTQQSPQVGGTSEEQEKRRNSVSFASHVQMCLIYYLATHAQYPSHALKTLRDHFGPEKDGCECNEYLSSVIDELKYQERVLQRLEMADHVGDTFKELVENSSRKNVGYKPYSWIMLPEDEFEQTAGDLYQVQPQGTAINPFSNNVTATSDQQLRQMRSDVTLVNASPEVGLASPFRELRNMRSTGKVVSSASKNEAGPSSGKLRQVKSKATVVNTSSESEATLPYTGQRRIRPSGPSVGTIKSEHAFPQRELHYKRSKPTGINISSDDDTSPLLRGLRSVKSKAEVVEATSGEEFTPSPRVLHHGRPNAMIGGEYNGSPRLQRVVRHIRSRPAVEEGLEVAKDPARQIWGGLKNDKKTSTGAGLTRYGESPVIGEESAASFRKIQADALKNKRSLGQDTLVSIAHRGQGDENVTPWL